MSRPTADRWEVRVFRLAVRHLAGPLARRFGDDMVRLFRDRLDDEGAGRRARIRLLAGALVDLLVSRPTGPRPHRGPGAGRVLAESLLLDLRQGFRALRRRPVFAGTVALTLALGIGGTTAMFGVVDAVLLRPLPYREPESLVSVWRAWPSWRGVDALDDVWDRIQYPVEGYLKLHEHARTLSAVEAVSHQRWSMTADGRTEEVAVGLATSGIFDMLGVRPQAGRTFTPEEALPTSAAGARVAIVSHETWVERFGADPRLLGRTLTLRGDPYEVVGILPPRFAIPSDLVSLNEIAGAPDPGRRDLWLPLGQTEARCGNCLEVLAHLAPGSGPEAAASELQGLLPDEGPKEQLVRVMPRQEYVTRGHDRPLLLLLGASALLMLVACLNVAGLLLGEAPARTREVSVRAALGASRARVVRHLLSESILLGLLGAIGGLVFATWGTEALLSSAPPIPRVDEVGPNLRILGFSAAAGLATGLTFGLLPAVTLARSLSLVRGGRGATRGRESRSVHRVLVAGQVGVAVVLLVASGLMARSLARLLATDPGFEPQRLVSFSVAPPPGAGTDTDGLAHFRDRVLRAAAAVPGVRGVSASTEVPFPGGSWSQAFGYEQDGAVRRATLWNRSVMPDYLDLMQVPLLAGRMLSESDEAGSPRIVVVSRSLAERLWPGESPLGKRLTQYRGEDDWWTVVGVVGDVRHQTLGAPPEPTLYRTMAQAPARRFHIVARLGDDANRAIPALQSAVWSVDERIAIADPRTMVDMILQSEADDRFRALLIGAFASLAGLLAALGIFGVTARSVAARSREIGIRSALGATPGRLVGVTMAEGLAPAAVGVLLGVAAARAGAGALDGLLYGIDAGDPTTVLGAATAALLASGLAAYLPARRAAALDPQSVLRSG